MGMMPQCIKIFFHALQPLVYPIFLNQYSTTIKQPREENDQAFSIAL
jgi:hypothetical protein